MMSPNDASLRENEGADVDRADRDGAEREGGAAKSDYHDLNCASLHPSKISTLPLTKMSYTNYPLKNDYSHIDRKSVV